MEQQQGRNCPTSRPEPARYIQTLLMPPRCLRMTLEVHGETGSRTYCLSVEASDPHTKELLALVLEPSLHADASLTLAQRVVSEVRAMLLDVLDPEPY